MGEATYAIPNFLGGQISAFAQGRFDKPDYRTSLNVCLNSFPAEIGAWTRRPGTRSGSHTRAGFSGRTMKFDFEQSAAVTMEFTDGFLRFRNGAVLVTTNDAVAITSISSANPAVVQTASAVTWVSGVPLIFSDLGTHNPLLQNRQFFAVKVDTTHFQLYDGIDPTVSIDGSTLGTFVSGTVSRIHEVTTPYVGGLWSGVRAVQAETTSMLLSPAIAPQALTVTTLPADGVNPAFALTAASLSDGPYLDPFTNGVQVTPSATTGVISLNISFPAYDATKAYASGSFVTSASVNYISLADQNVNNLPAISPAFWAATSAGAAINDGRGFLGTDTGRLVRLLSEPPAWAAATAYSSPNVISYNPTGQPGAAVYYQALANSTNIIPGTDITKWTVIPSNAAIWSWGKITGLSNVIDRALAGSVNIGTMTSGGGVAAAFNGSFSQAASAAALYGVSGSVANGATVSIDVYVGKDYSGASAQKISQATVYPSNDRGLALTTSGSTPIPVASNIQLNLRAKSTVPSGPTDGTLLGTTGIIVNTGSPITIISSDQTTSWNYVWIELIVAATISEAKLFSVPYAISGCIGQVSFFNPTGSGVSSGVNVEILGPPLRYSGGVIMTWRLGAYSDTTGWPTCGTYHEGRLWLGGAVANRFDASVSNGIVGSSINFAPTDAFGAVAGSNAISYTLNSDGVNPMYWMKPDLQGVVIGTQQGEWLVQAPTTGPIAPTNIAARRMTKNGSSNIEPARTENANVIVKRYGRKLLEYFADAYSGKYSAPNLADKAGDIVAAGIAEIAYVEAVTPIIWGRDEAGALFGLTYRRSTISTTQPPDFYAWHQHTLGSGRIVESLCSGPSVGGDLDALTMVTNDLTTNIRHVEVLTDTPDENTALEDAWFLDDAVTPSSTTSTIVPTNDAPYGSMTMNGLWHLNDKTVQIFAGGLDLGDRGDNASTFTDFVVSNGSVNVPYGDGVGAGPGRGLFTAAFAATASIVVGFTYNSDGQMVRPIAPADTGNRNGPALGLIRRNHRYAMLLANTRGISIGATFAGRMYPVQLKTDGGSNIGTLDMFSGIAQDPVQDSYSYEGMLCWRVSRPFPANLVAISGNIATQSQ